MATMLPEPRRIELPVADELELRKERIDLRYLIGAAADACRPQLDARHQTLSLRLPPDPVYLEADPGQLTQAIARLIENAAQYSEDGGAILVSAGGTSSEVTIRVADRGFGIETRFRARVSSLAKDIVELHGGSVEAFSAGFGRGSTFTVRVPRNS